MLFHRINTKTKYETNYNKLAGINLLISRLNSQNQTKKVDYTLFVRVVIALKSIKTSGQNKIKRN